MGEVAPSSVRPVIARSIRWDAAGVPVYGFQREPGAPSVAVLQTHDPAAGLRRHRHAHDFVVMAFVETGTGSVEVGGRRLVLAPGDMVVVGPGQAVDPGVLASGAIAGRAVSFPPDVITDGIAGRAMSWRSDPILHSFATATGDVHTVAVPERQREAVLARFVDIERELTERPDGWSDAALAHLTLLLIDVARIATADPAGLALRAGTLLPRVFAVIDEGYRRPLALGDVAAQVGLSPGHLTTVVRRRTGRTVQAWINERRMGEACRLLVETDLSVQEVGRRVGIPDASYFIRRFRRAHGRTPLQWRQAAAPP